MMGALNFSTRDSVAPATVIGALNDVEARNAPDRLFVRGDVDLLSRGPKVSIVGSRKASAAGVQRAKQLATRLVEGHVVVVSGLALGIDTAAHRAAIAAGGRTIAVLGTSLDQVYPRENEELQELIGREHLLVSQFEVGRPTLKSNFPQRNRTMALLTDATVIVEARDSSGSLHQGWEAIRLGRPLFILQSITEDKSLKWPAKMLEYGAQVLSTDNLGSVVENLPSFAHADAASF